MKKKIFGFLVAAVIMSTVTTTPVNASFFDDVGKKWNEFWLNAQAAIPFVPKSPKVVIFKMVKEMDKPKSAAAKIDLTADLKGATPMTFDVVLDMKGMSLNEKSSAQGKEDADMNFSGSMKVQGVTISAKGQMIVKGKDSYIKLDEAPNLGLIDLSRLKGTWYKLPPSETEEKKADESLNAKVEELLKKEAEKLMDKATKLPDEKVEGEDTYALQAILTKEDFKRIVGGISKLSSKEESVLPTESMTKDLESLNDVKLTLNIYKKNWYFAKMSFATTIQTEMPANPLSVAPSEKVDLDMKLAVTFKDYNVPFKIEAPANYKEFDPTLLMGGVSGTSTSASSSGSIMPGSIGRTPSLPPGIDRKMLEEGKIPPGLGR